MSLIIFKILDLRLSNWTFCFSYLSKLSNTWKRSKLVWFHLKTASNLPKFCANLRFLFELYGEMALFALIIRLFQPIVCNCPQNCAFQNVSLRDLLILKAKKLYLEGVSAHSK
jgi:hypothetical protein